MGEGEQSPWPGVVAGMPRSSTVKGNGMEASLNQYRDTATALNTPKATPTSRELAFAMVTLRRQLALG